MKGFLEKITATDFRKAFTLLIIIPLAVVVACAALNFFMFRTQLGELAALDKMEEQNIQAVHGQQENTGHNGDGEHEEDSEHGGADGHGHGEVDVFDAGLVTRPSTGAIVAAIGSIILCSLCALAYWLTVAAWLYKAAVKAGMNCALWSLLGLAFNFLAVFAFIIVRARLAHCASCGAWQKDGKFCINCGASLESVCRKCGTVCKPTDKFCQNCGEALANKGTDEAKA